MTPAPQGDAPTHHAVTSGDSGPALAFINTWETADADAQAHLLAAMRQEAPGMIQKSGLLAMSFLASADGKSLVVYALWSSQEEFDRGVTGDESAIQAREGLARWGTPSARTYQVAAVYPNPVETSTPDNADERHNQPGKRSPMNEQTTGARPPAGFVDGYADLDGVTLHFVSGGEGPLVVLLHGWPQTWYGWRSLLPLLAGQGYRVIAPDHRGLGDSSRPKDGYDRRTMALDLRQLLRSLGLSRVSVVGHDWGASVAYAYAAMYPEDVEHLAVIEGIPFGPWVTEEPTWSEAPASEEGWFPAFHQIPDLPETLVKGRERSYLTYFYRHFSADPTSVQAADIDEYVRTYSQPGAMSAGFGLYRGIPTDIADNLEFAKTRLQMPVLALEA